MVAARLLNATFSLTLHGSDLLVRAAYLDCKLENCRFCITISEFNRIYICQKYPAIDRQKILVHRLGVDPGYWRPALRPTNTVRFAILTVGRLHAVKNHDFLIRACGELAKAGVDFRCVIAGGGHERGPLLALVDELELQNKVELRGHVAREQLRELYSHADAVVFTSRSEGIPLAAMEAMAMERAVLAPAITGVPELIRSGRTGFLYRPGSMDDFVAKLMEIQAGRISLDEIRR